MRYALKRNIVSTQEAIVATWGDMVWHHLCYTLETPQGYFTVPMLAESMLHMMPHSLRYRTDIARVIIANVEAEYATMGTDAPFERRGNVYYWE